MNKRKKYNWFDMDPISVWIIVRKGKLLKTFPNNYLDKEKCRILIRHLALNELFLDKEQILSINQSLLSKYQLGGLRKFFDNKVYKLLIYSFPEYNEWEFKNISNEILKDPLIKEKYIRYVAKKENIDLNNIEEIKRFSARLLVTEYKGAKILKNSDGLYSLLQPVIPKEFKEWQIFKVDKWTIEKAKDALLWLVNDKLNLNKPYPFISTKTFYENNLGGLLCKFFGNSPNKAMLFLNSLED